MWAYVEIRHMQTQVGSLSYCITRLFVFVCIPVLLITITFLNERIVEEPRFCCSGPVRIISHFYVCFDPLLACRPICRKAMRHRIDHRFREIGWYGGSFLNYGQDVTLSQWPYLTFRKGQEGSIFGLFITKRLRGSSIFAVTNCSVESEQVTSETVQDSRVQLCAF